MRTDLPCCGLKTCIYYFDGNCMDKSKYEKCEYAELKSAEEQGLLLRLPCKAGDAFWEMNKEGLEPYIYQRVAHTLMHVIYCMERLGKVTFLTKAEAEEALREMKGDIE